MSKCKIAPSILSGDFAAMGQTVSNVQKWGADLVHCDVMDGVFVPNITFGMPMIKAIRPHTTLSLDVHLMIVEPEKYVERFCDAGADIVTFHPEASKDARAALLAIKAKGKKCGLVVNPDKGFDLVAPYMDLVDMIVLMGVFPGFGGQSYIESVSDNIALFAAKIAESGRDIALELDGGVTENNAARFRSLGITVLVAGSATFKAADPEKAIKVMRG